MLRWFFIHILVLVILIFAIGCGTNDGSEYLGRWENINEDYLDSFIIKASGDHYVFDIIFFDGSSDSYPATYEDGYFKIQMSGFTWHAFYEESTGYLIMDTQRFRKAN